MERTNTTFDYFYSDENEQYLFLQLPMMLIKDERFRELSDSSKILYSLFLNRTSLSKKNDWKDKHGRVYIIYTIEELMGDLNCYQGKVNKSMKELKACGLIRTVRQGLTKPNLIYVMNFATVHKYPKKDQLPESTKEPTNPYDTMNCDLSKSEIANSAIENLRSSQTSNTDNNNINFTKNDSKSMSSQRVENQADNDTDLLANHDRIKQKIHENIEYDNFVMNNRKDDVELADELVDCMLDVICTKNDTVKINGEEKDRNFVISQYMKLTSSEIEHIISRYKKQRHNVTHLHSYLKTMLYTAKQEINHFYTNQANSDFRPLPLPLTLIGATS